MKSQPPRAPAGSSPPNAQYSLRNKIHLLAMGCKYKRAIVRFYVSSLETPPKIGAQKRLQEIFQGRLLDDQHLSGMEIAAALPLSRFRAATVVLYSLAML